MSDAVAVIDLTLICCKMCLDMAMTGLYVSVFDETMSPALDEQLVRLSAFLFDYLLVVPTAVLNLALTPI